MQDAGIKYMIFTTKHHDGFCTFDSKYTDFSIAHGAFKDNPRKNVAYHVFDAFRKKGFMMGCYFSKPDWHCDDIGLDDILAQARRKHPGLISVDRSIRGKNENYQTPERGIPETQLDYPWESCITLSNDWGWVPNAPFKSPQKVINILSEITAKGGCLLLGVGPTPDGIIEEEVTKRLHEVGEWLRANGKAIYNTRITPIYQDGHTWFTADKDGQTLYAIYALPEGETMPETIEWT